MSSLCSLTLLPGFCTRDFSRISLIWKNLPPFCIWLGPFCQSCISSNGTPLRVQPRWSVQKEHFLRCSSLRDLLPFSLKSFSFFQLILLFICSILCLPLRICLMTEETSSCWLFYFLGLELCLAHRRCSVFPWYIKL